MTTNQHEVATLGGGCFWCLEAVFVEVKGVEKVVSGYAGGHDPNPNYREVCSGGTGHAEVVEVTFDPQVISYRDILNVFFSIHDPTTLNRQGNDVGTQYRSVIYTTTPAQRAAAEASKASYEARLREKGFRPITTQIEDAPAYYLAEEYHQQYLDKNPNGYCGIGGTGVTCA